jgi:hypothetical protein
MAFSGYSRNAGDLSFVPNIARGPGLRWKLANFRHWFPGWVKVKMGEALNMPFMYGSLQLVKVDGRTGERINYGKVGYRVVTTVGAAFMIDALQGIVEPEILKYHGFGTGTTAEAVGDTALVTEMTTQYNPDNTRPTGNLAEGASSNIFHSEATFTPDSGGSIVLREHGLFSANAAGTLFDRTVYAAITLDSAAGDSLLAKYEWTLNTGG